MPIMVRITIDGKLAQFNTKLEVNPKNWQAKTGKVSGRGKNRLAGYIRMNCHVEDSNLREINVVSVGGFCLLVREKFQTCAI